MPENESLPSKPPIETCRFCGKPTKEEFGGHPICMDCYMERGSCCQEQDE